MSDPFLIKGPAIVSFSGGRSSGMMLAKILRAHGGSLPDDIKVVFNNTGKEREETLIFVNRCSEQWDVEIVWVEWMPAETPADRWRVVDFATGSRNGEPFKQLIDAKGYLPNPVTRFCTQDLKINATHRWSPSVDMWGADRIVGFRADEPKRIARARAREAGGGDPWVSFFPLAVAGVTRRDVPEFWRQQNFDLELPSVDGQTPGGNCDLCFMKSAALVQALVARDPKRAAWWAEAEAEAEARASKPSGARFRWDRPSYGQMIENARRQVIMDFGDADAGGDCYCGDDV